MGVRGGGGGLRCTGGVALFLYMLDVRRLVEPHWPCKNISSGAVKTRDSIKFSLVLGLTRVIEIMCALLLGLLLQS